ncbi:MAG: pyridoxal-phosphate dependent enzyme, partial [Candidatus Diapherotrites archaeon]|nr:pyridoxal-phosphate dependent enzyme [Candidatus Diapherotrites archaeon]
MENILETIGNTPLVKVKEINNSKIYAKLERFNPGGSIKDRPVFEMFKIAEKQGLLKNKTIIEASSGNTGI